MSHIPISHHDVNVQGIIPHIKVRCTFSIVTSLAFKVKCNDSSLVAQRLKHLPVMQETWVRSLGQKDPQEKEMATHSSTLAWKFPWIWKVHGWRSLVGYSPWGHKELDTTEQLHFLSFLSSIRKSRVNCWLHHCQAQRPLLISLSFPSISVLFCKMRIIIITTS